MALILSLAKGIVNAVNMKIRMLAKRYSGNLSFWKSSGC